MSPRTKLIAAFAAVYVVWGSTYLAIRYAVATIPPLTMAGIRFIVAGTFLYLFARRRGDRALGRRGWISATILGFLFLVLGNGGVSIAEQWVASGVAAIIVALIPLYIALLTWLLPDGHRPSALTCVGIALGLVGVIFLFQTGDAGDRTKIDPTGVVVLLCGSFGWAVGTVYGRRAKIGTSSTMTTGMQMLTGGVLLLIAGAAIGEWPRFHLQAITPVSAYSLLYLIVFGSFIGFTSYNYLVVSTTPSRVATYAYVNPAIAVLLGWAIAGEPVTGRMLVAMGIIVLSVVITTGSTAETQRS